MAKFLGLDLGSNMLRVAVFDGAAGEFRAPFERVVGSARGMDGAGLSAAAQERVCGAVAALAGELGLDFRAGKIGAAGAAASGGLRGETNKIGADFGLGAGANSNLTAGGDFCANVGADIGAKLGADAGENFSADVTDAGENFGAGGARSAVSGTSGARGESFEYFAVATEAFRRAKNGSEFLAGLWRDFGVKFELIDGEREAWLSFLGVAFGALKSGALGADGADFADGAAQNGADGAWSPNSNLAAGAGSFRGDFGVGLGDCALVDLGGGSTEVCGFCGADLGVSGGANSNLVAGGADFCGGFGADFGENGGENGGEILRGNGGEALAKNGATNGAKNRADFGKNKTNILAQNQVQTPAQNGENFSKNPAQNCAQISAQNRAKISAQIPIQNREILSQRPAQIPAQTTPAALCQLRQIADNFAAFRSRSFKFGIIATAEQLCASFGAGAAFGVADSARLREFLRGVLRSDAARLGAFVGEVTGAARAFLCSLGARRLLLNSGVPTSVAAFKRGLVAANYDAGRVSGTRLGRGDFAALLRWLLAAGEGECERLVGAGRGGLVAVGILLVGGVLGWDLAGDFGAGGGVNSNLAAGVGENLRENGENFGAALSGNFGKTPRECGTNSNLPHITEIIAIDSGVGEGAALARFLGVCGAR